MFIVPANRSKLRRSDMLSRPSHAAPTELTSHLATISYKHSAPTELDSTCVALTLTSLPKMTIVSAHPFKRPA